jgi:hypothetical protein
MYEYCIIFTFNYVCWLIVCAHKSYIVFSSLGAILATDGMACTMEHHSMVDMATGRRFPTQTCMLRPTEPTLSTVTSN